MDTSIFQELIDLGLQPFPIVWDKVTKSAASHQVAHSQITHGKFDVRTIQATHNTIGWNEAVLKANGMALKLYPPFGMIDFDLKNTTDKTVFDKWVQSVESLNSDVLRKLCYESTRNKGYHVYIKYTKLSHKISLARGINGEEVVALYTGGGVSYCYPTDGYTMLHNDFNDLVELTDDEFDLLTSTAQLFNEYKEAEKEITFEKVNYPIEYENTCLQFDNLLPTDLFEVMLNEMGLYAIRDYRYKKNDKHVAYLRKGSTAKYSAKVYLQSKKLLLFSTSIIGYPTWMDRKNNDDKSWVLTPSRIIYYKNGRDWNAAINEILLICQSAGIEIAQTKITEQPILKDRTAFPYDIFPEYVTDYIKSHNLQHEYIAGAVFSAFACAVGNTCYVANPFTGGKTKPIIYSVIVAAAGSGKSPAIQIAFAPIQEADTNNFKAYSQRLKEYEAFEIAAKTASKNNKPTEIILQPILRQNIISKATIEAATAILSYNNRGCTVLADEAIGFLNRMGAYNSGDEVEQWLEAWDGSPIMVQRIGRGTNRLDDYTCNIFGGIQREMLSAFSEGKLGKNGFYERFLYIYPEPELKKPLEVVYINNQLKQQYFNLMTEIIAFKDNEVKTEYTLDNEAKALYKAWYDFKSGYYNSATEDRIKGIISKYQGYCIKVALIIQALNDGGNRVGIITASTMEKAIRLMEYFFGNLNKAFKILAPASPVDTLKSPYDKIYNELQPNFSSATAVTIAAKYKIKESAARVFLSRNKELFKSLGNGNWEKLL
jgi:hypothetical protein